MTGLVQKLMRTVLWLFVGLLVLGACQTERDRLMRENYPGYPAVVQQAIDRGALMRGMTHEQVFLALGEPLCKKTIQPNEKPIEVWLYPPAGRDPCLVADTRVYFEDGVVSRWK